MVSDRANCEIHADNMAPGQGAVEHVKITNDSGDPFTLKIKVQGTQNAFWNELQLGIWEHNTPAPVPLPALLLWTTQENTLTTLPAGDSIEYDIELALPSSAGNADQGKLATIELVWHAVG